uniref:Polynucleotide 5'-hydroxyl-kinase NOL9 n=1 Tax=Anopheles christyi TaxID=43041 RepID=A0A182KAI0_9DIPT
MANKNKNRKKHALPTVGPTNPVESKIKLGVKISPKDATKDQQQQKVVVPETIESKKKQGIDGSINGTLKLSPLNAKPNVDNGGSNVNGKEKKQANKQANKRHATVLDDSNGGGSDVSGDPDQSAGSACSSKRSRKNDSDSSNGRNNGGKLIKTTTTTDAPSKGRKFGKVSPGSKDNLKDASFVSKRKPSFDGRHGNGRASVAEPHKVPVVQCDSMEDNSTANSDSDEDDYIAKFFDDGDVQNGGTAVAKSKTAKQSKPKKIAKKATLTVSPGGWVVENNDCDLEYRASSDEDDEFAKPSTSSVKAVRTPVVAYKRKERPVIDEDDDDYEEVDDEGDADLYDSEDSDSDWTDDDEDLEDDDLFDDTYESKFKSYVDENGKRYMSDSFIDAMSGSDSYDEDYESSTDNSGSPDCYQRFMNGRRYDTDSDDNDYEPPGGDDTVYIARGTAVMHDLDDDAAAHLDKFGKFSQIVELPADYGLEKKEGQQDEAETEPGEKEADMETGSDTEDVLEAEILDEESDRSCPSFVESITEETYRFYDAVDLRMSLVALKAPLYIYGHLSVQALFGKVDILGYQLDMAEKRTVVASGGYNAINLTPLPSPDTYSKATFDRILNKLSRHFVESDLEQLAREFNPADSALVLLRADSFDENDTVPMVCKLLPDFDLFPTILTLNQNNSPFLRTEALLEVALFEHNLPTAKCPAPQFQPNPAWDTVQLKPESRLMVVGGKNSGKSTLCQYLINRHIKQFGRVLLLDLDIGQPLLFVPETLSVSVLQEPILGVGCFANVQPRKCQLFGSLNVVSSPLVYVQNVRTLVQYCNEDPELKTIPWIINTMGYVVGFGEELTMAIVRLVQPTDLVQLTYPKNAKKMSPFVKPENYANQLSPELVNGYNFNILREEALLQSNPVNYRFHSFDVLYKPNKASFFPPKRRTIAVMTQLAKILSDASETFSDVKPHMAHLDDLSIISLSEDSTSKDMMKRALNGSMVYLCEKLDNGQYNCFGVGIVRSVDDKNNCVYLLHSLSSEQLAKTNVLATGSMTLPSQVYLQCSPKTEGTIPYLQNMSVVDIA